MLDFLKQVKMQDYLIPEIPFENIMGQLIFKNYELNFMIYMEDN